MVEEKEFLDMTILLRTESLKFLALFKWIGVC